MLSCCEYISRWKVVESLYTILEVRSLKVSKATESLVSSRSGQRPDITVFSEVLILSRLPEKDDHPQPHCHVGMKVAKSIGLETQFSCQCQVGGKTL